MGTPGEDFAVVGDPDLHLINCLTDAPEATAKEEKEEEDES